MWVKILIGVAVGALLGGLLGSTRTCADGGCPLTSNWRRGSLWGAGMGLLVALALAPGGIRRKESPADGPGSDAVSRVGSAEDFERLVTRRDGKALIYFYTDSCAACAQYRPVFERVAARFADRAAFAKIDAAGLAELARRYMVEYVPTTILFDRGREVERFVGLVSEEKLAGLFRADAREP